MDLLDIIPILAQYQFEHWQPMVYKSAQTQGLFIELRMYKVQKHYRHNIDCGHIFMKGRKIKFKTVEALSKELGKLPLFGRIR